MSDSERMLHGRLVKRLLRQIDKASRIGSTPERRRKILETACALILCERRLEDPLNVDRDVSQEQLRDRIVLMAPGAGLEVAS